MENKYHGLDLALIETTIFCQLRCPGCYMNKKEIKTRRTKKDMDLNQAIKILDLCKKYKGTEIKEVHILGGEPLKWKYLKEFIEELTKRGIIPHLFTNMLGINKILAKWLHDRQVKITGKLNINPTGNNQEIQIQAKLIGSNVNTAKKMISKIKILQNAGYDKELLSLNNLIRKSNLKYVPEFYKWCLLNNLKPDLELLGSGTGKTDKKITPNTKELILLIKNLQKIRKNLNLNPGILALQHIFSGCDYCEHELYFNIDGNIKACSSDGLKILSNINEPNAIKKAYESKEIFARKNRNKESAVKPCNNCPQWDFCKGGCAATRQGLKNKIIDCPIEVLTRKQTQSKY